MSTGVFGPTSLDIADVCWRAEVFRGELDRAKNALRPTAGWYPYDSLSNFGHLNLLLSGGNRDIGQIIGGSAVLDIGAADGDTSFFLASLGYSVDVVDNPPTNYNSMEGLKILASHFRFDHLEVFQIDLDSQFHLPRARYGLVLFLGLLYHLQNPFYVLKALREHAEHCLISTRVARYAMDGSTRLDSVPVAYLLDPQESNNDPTNYWIFSTSGLKRLARRCGWQVLDFTTLGDTEHSNPGDNDRDERAFALLKRIPS